MADRAKKISELTALTNASGDDLLVIVDDPSGAPATKKIALSNLFANVSTNTALKTFATANNLTVATLIVSNTSTFTNTVNLSNTVNLYGNVNLTQSITVPGLYFANVLNTPASSGAPGIKGEIRVDSSYIYVCVANNVWKRASLSTW